MHRRFAGLYHLGHLKIEVFSFVETALTLMSVLYMRIVGVDSAGKKYLQLRISSGNNVYIKIFFCPSF